MKKLITLMGLLCIAHSLCSQLQWEHTGGPEGLGNCTSYYNQDFAFVYDNFQLYRTGDGQSWEVINTTASGKVVVAEDRISIYREFSKGPDNPKDIQFLLSADQGDTWYTAPVPPDAYFNFNEIMICTHGIYFQTGEKLYRSQNDGQSWKQVSYDSIAFSSLFTADDRVFGRNDDRIFEFNPQSGKWVFSWNMPVSGGILESLFIKDSTIILKSANKFYSSLNKGEVWITFATQSTQLSHLIEKDNKVYFQSGNFIRYTENGGYSWKSILLDGPYKNMVLIRNKFLLFSAKNGCFLFDESTNSYLPANTGLHSSGILGLWAGVNAIWAQLYSDNSIYKYDVVLGQWRNSRLPQSAFYRFNFLISATGYLLYDFNSEEIFISTNQSADWDTLTLPFSHSHYLENFFWIGDFIYVESDSGQKYISKDLGLTWDSIPRQLISGVVFKDQIWAIDHSRKLIVSGDMGLNWADVDIDIENLSTLFVADDRIFISTPQAKALLFSSTDGIKWQSSGDGLSSYYFTGSRGKYNRVWKLNEVFYFKNDYSGLYYSIDNCSSWESANIGQQGESLAVLNDTVYIGLTGGGGVFKSPLPDFSRQLAKGSIFHDLNGDGKKDPNEEFLSDVQIMINTTAYPSKDYFSLSDEHGQFEIRASYQSKDTIRPNLFSEYIENIDPPFYIAHDSIQSFDFAVRFRPNIADGNISGTYNRQPGSGKDINLHLQYQNTGTVALSGVVSLKTDPAFNFIQSTPPPSLIYNDSLVWQFEDLAMLEKKQILVEGQLSFFLETDSLIRSHAYIFPDQADEDTSDNFILIQDKVGSNSNTFFRKRVNPELGMTTSEMRQGKELEYTIYFQNPSNVEVKDIRISDVLAAELDVNTIRIIGSSHIITKWELLPSRILRVYFDHANLPAGNSGAFEVQGFFKFGIRIRKDNNPNFYFNNTANIIFDNLTTGTTNSVLTRWTEEVISGTYEARENLSTRIRIVPNPASKNCYLSTGARLKGNGTIRIFNAGGQVLYSQQVPDFSTDIELNIGQIPNGFYLITAEGAEGIMHGRLIIQK